MNKNLWYKKNYKQRFRKKNVKYLYASYLTSYKQKSNIVNSYLSGFKKRTFLSPILRFSKFIFQSTRYIGLFKFFHLNLFKNNVIIKFSSFNLLQFFQYKKNLQVEYFRLLKNFKKYNISLKKIFRINTIFGTYSKNLNTSRRNNRIETNNLFYCLVKWFLIKSFIYLKRKNCNKKKINVLGLIIKHVSIQSLKRQTKPSINDFNESLYNKVKQFFNSKEIYNILLKIILNIFYIKQLKKKLGMKLTIFNKFLEVKDNSVWVRILYRNLRRFYKFLSFSNIKIFNRIRFPRRAASILDVGYLVNVPREITIRRRGKEKKRWVNQITKFRTKIETKKFMPFVIETHYLLRRYQKIEYCIKVLTDKFLGSLQKNQSKKESKKLIRLFMKKFLLQASKFKHKVVPLRPFFIYNPRISPLKKKNFLANKKFFKAYKEFLKAYKKYRSTVKLSIKNMKSFIGICQKNLTNDLVRRYIFKKYTDNYSVNIDKYKKLKVFSIIKRISLLGRAKRYKKLKIIRGWWGKKKNKKFFIVWLYSKVRDLLTIKFKKKLIKKIRNSYSAFLFSKKQLKLNRNGNKLKFKRKNFLVKSPIFISLPQCIKKKFNRKKKYFIFKSLTWLKHFKKIKNITVKQYYFRYCIKLIVEKNYLPINHLNKYYGKIGFKAYFARNIKKNMLNKKPNQPYSAIFDSLIKRTDLGFKSFFDKFILKQKVYFLKKKNSLYSRNLVKSLLVFFFKKLIYSFRYRLYLRRKNKFLFAWDTSSLNYLIFLNTNRRRYDYLTILNYLPDGSKGFFQPETGTDGTNRKGYYSFFFSFLFNLSTIIFNLLRKEFYGYLLYKKVQLNNYWRKNNTIFLLVTSRLMKKKIFLSHIKRYKKSYFSYFNKISICRDKWGFGKFFPSKLRGRWYKNKKKIIKNSLKTWLLKKNFISYVKNIKKFQLGHNPIYKDMYYTQYLKIITNSSKAIYHNSYRKTNFFSKKNAKIYEAVSKYTIKFFNALPRIRSFFLKFKKKKIVKRKIIKKKYASKFLFYLDYKIANQYKLVEKRRIYLIKLLYKILIPIFMGKNFSLYRFVRLIHNKNNKFNIFCTNYLTLPLIKKKISQFFIKGYNCNNYVRLGIYNFYKQKKQFFDQFLKYKKLILILKNNNYLKLSNFYKQIFINVNKTKYISTEHLKDDTIEKIIILAQQMNNNYKEKMDISTFTDSNYIIVKFFANKILLVKFNEIIKNNLLSKNFNLQIERIKKLEALM